ncbi:hypothetical protein K1X76_11665 [bacterium]|nr:hypothetical protein [bacterium]
MKNKNIKSTLTFLMISFMVCSFTTKSFAQESKDFARTFINKITEASTVKGLLIINDAQASQIADTNISTQVLVYGDFNNAIFSMDPLDNAHIRYLYHNKELVSSVHFKRDEKQIYTDQPLNPFNSVDHLKNDIPKTVETVLLWIARNPSHFISWEPPSQFGIKDGGWAKTWVHLQIPILDYHFFLGFINNELSAIFIANKENQLLYTIQVLKLEFNKNISQEKFTTFRKHPLDETPSAAEKWWRDAYYQIAQ